MLCQTVPLFNPQAHGVNVFDSKHHSKTYCQRLEKYSKRHGFAVGLPGFRPEHVTEKILTESYIFVKDRDLLVKIEQYGMPSVGHAAARLLDNKTEIQYSMAHRVSTVHGLKRLLVWDGFRKGSVNVRHAQSPAVHPPVCDCGQRRAETFSPNTVVVKSAGAQGAYFLLWGVELPDSEAEVEDPQESVSDIDGYFCTPIERAYALFDRLLDENLMAEDAFDGGAVTKLLGRTMHRQNGHISCNTAARQYDPSWRSTEQLSFVFDFVPCETATFDDLRFVKDAGRAPLHQLDDAAFESTYGLPRTLRLSFKCHRPREPLEQDMLSSVYV